MRKRILEVDAATAGPQEYEHWLDLKRLASVEVTSEDPAFPIENVFLGSSSAGWRASQPGVQKIRIVFDAPTRLHRVELRFKEDKRERNQEFSLHYSPVTDGAAVEIRRQQWSFSPGGSTVEIEDYAVDLPSVSVLELSIRPDSANSDAVASLSSWRLA